MIEELGAGEVVGGAVDFYPVKKEPLRIAYDPAKINALLGTDISEEDMIRYFETIDLPVDREKREVIVPTWRQDLSVWQILQRKLQDFTGYDNIPDDAAKRCCNVRWIISEITARRIWFVK